MKGLGMGRETGVWEKRKAYGRVALTDAERSSLGLFDLLCCEMKRDREKEAGRKVGSGEDPVYRGQVVDEYVRLYGSG